MKLTEINEYEDSLTLKNKKERGIFYTDSTLATAMFHEIGLSEDSIVYDPYCGAGIFTSIACALGFNKVYGSDIDDSALQVAKKLSVNSVVKCFDGINNDLSCAFDGMCPDLIIGNPPYVPLSSSHAEYNQKTQYLFEKYGKNLFTVGLYRSLELLKNEGTLSYIIPKNFLFVNTYRELRKYLISNYEIRSIVDLGLFFKNVRGEQIVLTVNKKLPSEKHQFQVKKYLNGMFVKMTDITQNSIEDKIILFHSEKEKRIYEKLTDGFFTLSQYTTSAITRGKSKSDDSVKGKMLQKFSYKDGRQIFGSNKIFIQNIYSVESGIIGAIGNHQDAEAQETVTIIKDGDILNCRFLLAILHSNLCNYYLSKFVYNSSKVTMHTDGPYLGKIPIPNASLSQKKKIASLVIKIETEVYRSEQWFKIFADLNSYIYRIYGFKKEEKEFIENEMKSYQSVRWWNQ